MPTPDGSVSVADRGGVATIEFSHPKGNGASGAMALDADWRSAEWAHTVGLYAQVHDTLADVDAAYDAFVARLAASNPEATTRIKRALWTGTEDWDTLLDERAAMSGKLVLSEHTRKAIASFKAK